MQPILRQQKGKVYLGRPYLSNADMAESPKGANFGNRWVSIPYQAPTAANMAISRP